MGRVVTLRRSSSGGTRWWVYPLGLALGVAGFCAALATLPDLSERGKAISPRADADPAPATTRLLVPPTTDLAAAPRYRVTRVIDGDTVDLRVPNRGVIRVRLECIDAPESDQAFGRQSRQHLSRLLKSRRVVVEITDADRHGRAIARLYPEDSGVPVNWQMLRDGYAWHYRQYSCGPAYSAAHAAAKREAVGLWSRSDALPPWVWRRRAER